MIGLLLSEIVLFLVLAIAGAALGWRLSAHSAFERLRVINGDTDALRAALSDAHVRRAARAP